MDIYLDKVQTWLTRFGLTKFGLLLSTDQLFKPGKFFCPLSECHDIAKINVGGSDVVARWEHTARSEHTARFFPNLFQGQIIQICMDHLSSPYGKKSGL